MRSNTLLTLTIVLFGSLFVHAQPSVESIPFKDANQKYGYKDATGKVVIPAAFDSAEPFKGDVALVSVPDPDREFYRLYFLIGRNGRQITKSKYEQMSPYEGIYLVRLKTTWGFVSPTGKELVTPIYEFINDNNSKGFPDGLASAKLNGKWGLINTAGKVLVPFTFERIDDCSDGLCAAYANTLGGHIDRTGRFIIPAIYKSVFPFYNGSAWACKREGCSIIDKAGRALTPFKYQFNGLKMTATFHDGFAPVYLNKKLGFINLKGEEVIPCIYDYEPTGNYDFFVNGKARVIQNGKVIYIDKPSEETFVNVSVPTKLAVPKSDVVTPPDANKGKLSIFRDASNKAGYKYEDGTMLVAPKYDQANQFADGMALVNIGRIGTANGKWGFVDAEGKERIPLKYDSARDFSDGLAAVNVGGTRAANGLVLGGKWSYIDKTGREVIGPKYDFAASFRDGVAVIGVGIYPALKVGLISRSGNELTPQKYDGIWDPSDGMRKVRLAGKIGFIDINGREVIQPIYTSADNFVVGKAKVTAAGRTFYIDKSGKEIP